LYSLVSASLLKNYFLGLPCYLIVWIFCWVSLSQLMLSWKTQKNKTSWYLLGFATVVTAVVAIEGARHIGSWKGHDLEEGRQDRAAMQQIAVDLRQVASNEQSFVSMPTYGVPATLLFYMPYREGGTPRPVFVEGTNAGPVSEFLQRVVEPAKAVLVYEDGNKFRGWTEVGWSPDADLLYYTAVAAWVRRPGSSHHLFKTYELYSDTPGEKATVQLYVKNDEDHTVAALRHGLGSGKGSPSYEGWV
jgi:hypothetical protein